MANVPDNRLLATLADLLGKADKTHTHAVGSLEGWKPYSTSVTHADSVPTRDSTGNVNVPLTPSTDYSAVSKAYAVAKAGTTQTVWSGTQAQYDALPAATKNAAGFVAVIMS